MFPLLLTLPLPCCLPLLCDRFPPHHLCTFNDLNPSSKVLDRYPPFRLQRWLATPLQFFFLLLIIALLFDFVIEIVSVRMTLLDRINDMLQLGNNGSALF